MGRLAFLRAYSGKLDAGSYVFNTRTGKKERVARLYQMHSNHQNPIEFVEAGDICAAVGFKDLRTGDTVCLEEKPITLETMEFPDPVIGIAVEPKTQKDLDKLGIALGKLAEEDPTFTVKSDHETGQTVISGMGELHLDIIVDRLRREFGVDINQGAPQVNYKESITSSYQIREVFKKQTGGRGKFADIIVEISPADEGVMGLQFDNQVKGGNIPKEYIPSIEKGFQAAMANGVLAGYEVPALKVTVLDGSYHPVDSDQLSFELAARMAFRHGPEPSPRPDCRHGFHRQWCTYRQGIRSARGAVRICHGAQDAVLRTRHFHHDFRPLRRGPGQPGQGHCREERIPLYRRRVKFSKVKSLLI